MSEIHFNNRESPKRGRAAATASLQAMVVETGKTGLRPGFVEWHIPTIERVTAQEFEKLLVKKFGPEYLQPIHYRRVDGVLVPDVVEGVVSR